MKSIIAALALLFLVLQYQLWVAKGGLFSAWQMRHNLEKQQITNSKLEKRNNRLQADIKDLKYGKQALEEHARNDLGMVKNNETFYQVVNSSNDDSP